MSRQTPFPQPLLEVAIESMLPQTRQDMSAREIHAYVVEHSERLSEALRNYGVDPDHYTDVPTLADPAELDANAPLDDASREAINAVAKTDASTPSMSRYLRSTGPLWSPTADDPSNP